MNQVKVVIGITKYTVGTQVFHLVTKETNLLSVIEEDKSEDKTLTINTAVSNNSLNYLEIFFPLILKFEFLYKILSLKNVLSFSSNIILKS